MIHGRISLRLLVRLWFAPSSEGPIYRQLVTQVVLAILSGDVRPGERLPSTRELARRFAIPLRRNAHPHSPPLLVNRHRRAVKEQVMSE